MKINNQKKIAIIFTSAILVIVFVLKLYSFTHYVPKDIEFSKEKWNMDVSQRELMLESLNQKYPLKTMNREKVLNLLGSKDAKFFPNQIEYVIGDGLVDPILLSNTFDNNGKVSSWCKLEP